MTINVDCLSPNLTKNHGHWLFHWERIIWNETMWKKVFYPCLDEEVIGALLTIIKKKVYPY
jgi:hypothetical protein